MSYLMPKSRVVAIKLAENLSPLRGLYVLDSPFLQTYRRYAAT